MRVRSVAAALALATSTAIVGSNGAISVAAEPTPADLAQSLQKKYNAVRDFSTDFVQMTTGGVVKTRQTEKGRLFVKKPGRMLWEYKTPEEKTFVSDGASLYAYTPLDKQVIVTPMPEGNSATIPILFLTGKGDLTRDFLPANTPTAAGMPAGTRTLKLTPKVRQADYEWLALSFAPDTFILRGLSTADLQGSLTSFTFTNLKENTGIEEKFFVFKMPKGVQIITDTPQR